MILLELMLGLVKTQADNASGKYVPHCYIGAFEAVMELQRGHKLSYSLAFDLLAYAQYVDLDTMIVQDIQELIRDYHGHDIDLGWK